MADLNNVSPNEYNHTMSQNLVHRHRKKRKATPIQPESDRLKRAVDVLIFPVGFLSVFALIPQFWNIWVLHDASGVSFATWILAFCANIVWVTYGIVHRDRAIITISACQGVLQFSIAIGVLVWSK